MRRREDMKLWKREEIRGKERKTDEKREKWRTGGDMKGRRGR